MEKTWEKHEKSVIHLDDMHNVLNLIWWTCFGNCSGAMASANFRDPFISITWIKDGANSFMLKHGWISDEYKDYLICNY